MSDDIRVVSSPDEWSIRVDNGDFRLVQHPDEFDIQRDTEDWHIDTRVQSTVKVVFKSVGLNDAAAAITARNAAEAAAAQTGLDAVATAADRVQTGLDAVATAADRVAVAADKVTVEAAVVTTAGHAAAAAQSASDASDDADATDADRILTAADRVQTGADRVQTGLDAAATAADRVAVANDKADTATYRTDALNAAAAADADAVQVAADRVQTGLDAAATAADRVQTGLDVTSTGSDAAATAADRVQTGADRVQTGIDRAAAEAAAAAAAVYDPAPFIAHVSDNANPHGVTAAQVGAATPADVAASEASAVSTIRAGVAAAGDTLAKVYAIITALPWGNLTGVPAAISGTTASFTTALLTKLNGIATGATANSTDAQLRDRATHTGTQTIATVSDLQTALDAKQDNLRDVSVIELSGNLGGTDRSTFIDFHSAAAVSDYNARIIRNATVNGSWVFTQQGTGPIAFSGGSDMTYGGVSLARISGAQSFSDKTLVDPVIQGTILEDIYTIVDAAGFQVDPGNGSIQQVTLGASRTPAAANFANGESVTLMVNDGTARTLTWTTMAVVWVGGSAPTLATTGWTVIELWKVAGTLYGAHVGDVA